MSGAWWAGILAAALAGAPDEALEPADDAAEETEEATPEADASLAPAPEGAPLAAGGPVLVERMERPDGSALERLVEPSGDVVVHEVNRVGTVMSCRTVGSLFTMRVVEQREAARGEVVHLARDATGALLRYVVGADGEPRAVVLVSPAPTSVGARAGAAPVRAGIRAGSGGR